MRPLKKNWRAPASGHSVQSLRARTWRPPIAIRIAVVVSGLCFLLGSARAEATGHDVSALLSTSVNDLNEEDAQAFMKNLKTAMDVQVKEMITVRSAVEKLNVEDIEMSMKITEMERELELSSTRSQMASEELAKLNQEVVTMEKELGGLSTSVEDLEVELSTITQNLVEIEKENEEFRQRASEPLLIDVLDNSVANWGDTSRGVLRKAVKDVIPAVEDLGKTASAYRVQMTKMSRIVALAASVFLYSFTALFVYFVYTVYRKTRGRFTLSRMLFLGDLFCTLFWAIILVLYVLLLTDPMFVMQKRSPVAFFLFQIAAMGSYVVYAYLRVIAFADNMGWTNLGELLAVVVIGHHYYLRVWLPSMSDVYNENSYWMFYACYMWLFGAFMYSRVQAFAPLKQLRGQKLDMITWFRILKKRFWEDERDLDDVETLSLDEDEDDSSYSSSE
ncbi:hypothetical protein FVE85_7131 [Porphyridium purpureum]|uniref:Uncharacterized protein n=1 Tax=Porphyridium purpureum TaxID=35688 RepID=A0A5J4Z737_PORPP|nr:hypothetical protein FVE85_7131 [Porphyridium purpureum]|eukprot:POR4835..scf295_1